MTTIANCKCGQTAEIHHVTQGYSSFLRCCAQDCWEGPLRDTEELAIAVWNALMSPAKPEPAPGTVWVRIAMVHDGNLLLPYGYYDVKRAVWSDGTQKLYNGASVVAYITADIPLPQPQEIKGSVE